MSVLGDKQRVEAALFDRCGQGSRRDSFVGHERRDTELHAFIEPYPEASEVIHSPKTCLVDQLVLCANLFVAVALSTKSLLARLDEA